LATISHDLRTPLTGIVGASGVIVENIEQLDKFNIEKLVSDINEEAIWLNSLVENILNMTRISEGKLVIKKNFEVVDDIVYEAISHVKNLAKTKNMVVSMPDEVVTLLVDGKLIVQVIINLLENAIKHTEDHCDTIVGVSIEEYQFMSKETSVGVPNSDTDFGSNYANPDMVLGSKITNNETYSANMATKAGSTKPLIESWAAIEEFATGKTVAELEKVLAESTPGEVVDAVSSSTLVDTHGYIASIVEAAKAAK